MGNDTFLKVSSGPPVEDSENSVWVEWIDYDLDGYVDLSVADVTKVTLYRNKGNGTFSTGISLNESADKVMWADYDNDNDPDLLAIDNFRDHLYENNGDGSFTKHVLRQLVHDSESANAIDATWGDYDNDGDMDLYLVSGGSPSSNLLYRNNGDGTFTNTRNLNIVNDQGDWKGAAWGDFNNDGDLDLLAIEDNGSTQSLYQSDGDGTFTFLNSGIQATGSSLRDLSWGDYDDNVDVFIPINQTLDNKNGLFLNNALSGNNWIKVELTGVNSNYTGIGAKVRAKTSDGWQLREITCDGTLLAEFGLRSNATVAELRVEWPSGAVNFLFNVASNQLLNVTEPPNIIKFQNTNMLPKYTCATKQIRAGENVDATQTSGPVTIQTTGPVTFQAGDEVRLADGFTAPLNSEFRAFAATYDLSTTNPTTRIGVVESTAGIIQEELVKEAVEESILIYPNPSRGSFNIQLNFEEPQNLEVSVLTLSGKVIHEIPLQAVSSKLLNYDLGNLNYGIYLVKITTDNRTITKRIIIEK